MIVPSQAGNEHSACKENMAGTFDSPCAGSALIDASIFSAEETPWTLPLTMPKSLLQTENHPVLPAKLKL